MKLLGMSKPTATRAIELLAEADILAERTERGAIGVSRIGPISTSCVQVPRLSGGDHPVRVSAAQGYLKVEGDHRSDKRGQAACLGKLGSMPAIPATAH
jgi:hypothetical protein